MATQLTKNYEIIGTIPLNQGEIRIYSKYTAQNIENNVTYISIKVVYYVSYGSVSFDSASASIYVGNHPAKTYSYGYTTVYYGENTMYEISDSIEHNEQGIGQTTIGVNWWASFGGTGYKSVSVSVPTIDRYPLIRTAPDFNDEENPTITYSTIMGFENATLYGCISVDGTTDTVPYRQLVVEDGQYTFNLTTTERNALRNATPNSSILPVTFILKTTVGDDNYYSTLQKNMTIINALPTCTHSEVELNQNVINVLGTSSATTVVESVSNIRITVNPVALKGASIKRVRVIQDGTYYTKVEAPFVFDILIRNGIFDIEITDTRDFVSTTRFQKTLIPYTKVKINSYSLARQNPTSSNVILNLQATYTQTTFGSTANVPTVKWKLDNGSYTTIPSSAYTIDTTNKTLTISNYTLSNALPYTSKGYFSIDVSDLLTSVVENDILVIKGIPTFDYGEHDLKVNGDLYVADTDGENAVNVLNKINNNETKINNTRTYATTETVVGEWLGKPLYRKVINTGALPNATSKLTPHGISNIDRVVSIHGYAYRESGQTTITLPFPSTGNNGVVCDREGANVVIVAYIDRRNFTESYVTLEYTKTTD